jgi:hypothetical protein
MKQTALVAALGLCLTTTALYSKAMLKKSKTPFVGQWDITVNTPTTEYPDWLEVIDDNGTPKVRLQQRTGSVHPVPSAHYEGKHLQFVISPASDKSPAISWDIRIEGNRLTGTLNRGEMTNAQISGVRAPAMKRKEPKAWTTPEPLFNGKDLAGWQTDNLSKVNWVVKDGAILNESGGANLKTLRKFQDFKLHIEYNCPNLGNSGIYLRGRYEFQVEYEKPGVEDNLHEMGSIYGMLAPSHELPRKPGEWETLDITLVGRTVTVVRNGIATIEHRQIPGITGGALDANEAQPGPFYLQGDHTGGMMYRNITVSVPEAPRKLARLKKH